MVTLTALTGRRALDGIWSDVFERCASARLINRDTIQISALGAKMCLIIQGDQL